MLSEEDQTQHEHGVQHGGLSDAWVQREHQRLIAFAFAKTTELAEVQ